MATIKSYTDISQSKTLSKILPLESADMCYLSEESLVPKVIYNGMAFFDSKEEKLTNIIYCWSLAALLNYLREIDFFPEIEADEHGVTMSINYYDEEEARLLAPVHNIKVKTESFIDACVEMIEKLDEQKLL